VNGSNFTYLNRESRWVDFAKRYGVTVAANGQVNLLPVPAISAELPSSLRLLPRPDAAAGVATTADGKMFYTIPLKHELWRLHPCEERPHLLPCVNHEEESSNGVFRNPRGLLFHSIRRSLVVVDSGNDRLLWFDPETLELKDVWGSTGSQAGALSDPWTVAADSHGNVYVTDVGNRRVQKFTLNGEAIPEFWTNIVTSVPAHWALQRPVDVTVLSEKTETKIFLLDVEQSSVVVVDNAGIFMNAFRLSGIDPGEALSFTVTAEAVYVGAHGVDGRGEINQYQLDGTLDGTVRGYDGPVASLRLSHRQTLLINPGAIYSQDKSPIVECLLVGAFRESGFLWGGPFSTPSKKPIQWHLLVSQYERVSEASHLQFYVYFAGSAQAPPQWNGLPETEPPWRQESEAFGQVLEEVVEADSKSYQNSVTKPKRHRDRWIRMTLDTAHALLPGEAGDHLWVGIEFIGDGLASPMVSQVRIDWDHDTYLQYLPEIYRKDLRSSYFLARFLSTYETLYLGVESSISKLRNLFDPFAVPTDLLPWLAGWLALDMNPDWPEQKRREAIAQAFERDAWRGTSRGLRHAIQLYTGVNATIEEPLLYAAWWMLPDTENDQGNDSATSLLGVTSMLVPAEAQGAVVGTTAVLDQSHLIGQTEFGVPLFSDVAYQFTVQVYQGQVQDERKLHAVQAVIEREKPAHTAHHLCIVKPMMRIGFQSRLGIDTVMAGPSLPTRFGGMSMPQEEMVLGGPQPGEMGVMARAGMSTYLKEGSIDQKQQ
jgi:phage tail-like protein